jgi:hypothetical protein
MGSGGEIDSGQHQAGAGPAPRERPPVAAATHGGDVGMPALRHMRRLGNWLARLAVDQVPRGHAGSSPARRTLEGPADGRRRQPSRKRKAHTGVRVRSSLPPPSEGDAGVARRPVATWVVASAMRFDSSAFRQALSVQLEWTPACRAGDHGFESRTERAAPWWLLAANPDFQSGPRGFDPRPRHITRAPMVQRSRTRGSQPGRRWFEAGHPLDGCSRPAWRNQVDARRSGRRALRCVPVRVRGRVRNGL